MLNLKHIIVGRRAYSVTEAHLTISFVPFSEKCSSEGFRGKRHQVREPLFITDIFRKFSSGPSFFAKVHSF